MAFWKNIIERNIKLLEQTTDPKTYFDLVAEILSWSLYNDHTICKKYIAIALKLLKKRKAEDTLFNVKLIQLYIYEMEGNYVQTIDITAKVLLYVQTKIQKRDIALFHNNLASLFFNVSNMINYPAILQKSLIHTIMCLDALQNKQTLIPAERQLKMKNYCYVLLTSIYIETNQPKEAEHSLQLLITALQDLDNETAAHALQFRVLELRARLCLKLKQYPKAFEYVDKALAKPHEAPKELNLANCYYWRGEASLGLDNIDAALVDFQMALATFQKLNFIQGILLCEKAIIAVLEKRNQFKEAFLQMKIYLDKKENLETLQKNYLYPFLELLNAQHHLNLENTIINEEDASTHFSPEDKKFAKQVYVLIQNNYSKNTWRTPDLALSLGVSIRTLHRKFFQLFATTPNDLLAKYRLHIAQNLLKQKLWSITQIAEMVGYSNASYFAQAFKKQFNYLPSDFLAKN